MSAPDLSTEFLSLPLANPLMNASGVWCTRVAELEALLDSAAGAMVTKSCTLTRRDGNPEPRYRTLTGPGLAGSLNSMGLPNEGHGYYLDYAAQHDYEQKPLFFSVSGLTLDDNLTIVAAARDAVLPVQLELNLSCPNVPGKAQPAYDFAAMDELVTEVASAYRRPFGVKLPPYFDFAHFDAAAEILNRHDHLAWVTCINSVGNALVIDTANESTVIRPKDGFGGLGGDYVLPIALANVNAFHRRCPGKVIIGCGGVRSGEHVFQHLLAGATLVQVGTALYEEGLGVFSRLNRELARLMESKGYSRIADFQGALRTL
ncbi:dihydroorotate oxidase [Chitinolyticbacter meiyuanensis]|uniref:dihydroorotate oxidase n=1 Tax=Chitinolyticbacter meiyuanensis TaxID=682798 RepID=UPI0011E60276|nr:dihydroorotate oxidase [Chitinolyticbacter meiyuanensis]